MKRLFDKIFQTDARTRQIREELYQELEPGGKYEGLYVDPEIVVATVKGGGFHLF